MTKYNWNKLDYKQQVIGKYVTQNLLQVKIQVICIEFGLTIIHIYIQSHKNARKLLKGNLIRLTEWPAQSPDLNPIENLWADVKKKNNKERWADVRNSQNNIPKNCAQTWSTPCL